MIFTDEQVKYEELYRNMIGQMELMHKDNLKRLKIGFRCILIVPTIFLLLLLFTQSSKVVFLILWIVSMFIMAAYLVGVEYSDYKLQARINEATDNEGAQTTTLMSESIEENKSALHDLLMREESHLPFKFGVERKDEDLDAAEYDTGDVGAFSPEDAASAFEAYAADFDDSDFGAGGLSSDDYDALPVESGEVLTSSETDFEQGADEGFIPAQTAYNPADGFPILDIDDDMDDLETLLTADDVFNAVEPQDTETKAKSEYAPLPSNEAALLEVAPEPAAELESELSLDDILSEYHNDFFEPEELTAGGDTEAVPEQEPEGSKL